MVEDRVISGGNFQGILIGVFMDNLCFVIVVIGKLMFVQNFEFVNEYYNVGFLFNLSGGLNFSFDYGFKGVEIVMVLYFFELNYLVNLVIIYV